MRHLNFVSFTDQHAMITRPDFIRIAAQLNPTFDDLKSAIISDRARISVVRLAIDAAVEAQKITVPERRFLVEKCSRIQRSNRIEG